MAAKKSRVAARGTIRQRGNSTGSAATEEEAEKVRTRLLAEVDAQRHPKTRATFRAAFEKWLRVHKLEQVTRDDYACYARMHLYPVFGDEPVARITADMLEECYAELGRCSARCRGGRPAVDHRTAMKHECRVVRHKRRPGRPRANEVHDCDVAGCVVVECPPHQCRPLADATVRKVHFAISGVMSAAQRWGWISSNPAEIAEKPRQPTPEPDPPSAEDAARIIEAAWAEDESWGTLVWLVMVTGVRRAELLACRWFRVDLTRGTLQIRRNWVGGNEKDTERAF